jgi:hypothetical protein
MGRHQDNCVLEFHSHKPEAQAKENSPNSFACASAACVQMRFTATLQFSLGAARPGLQAEGGASRGVAAIGASIGTAFHRFRLGCHFFWVSTPRFRPEKGEIATMCRGLSRFSSAFFSAGHPLQPVLPLFLSVRFFCGQCFGRRPRHTSFPSPSGRGGHRRAAVVDEGRLSPTLRTACELRAGGAQGGALS